jgi:hypothetical protein
MASKENYEAPFDVEPETMDPELREAHDAWVEGELAPSEPLASEIDADTTAELDTAEPQSSNLSDGLLSEPFVGQWHELISRTNWEKGRIISEWRQALISSAAPATAYSDEAWAQQVGGVTSPHVGRLRRVYDQFGSTCASYPKLSWTHFLVAMDWDDAPMWLQGASDGSWSVSGMRKQRWETLGGSSEDDPNQSPVATNDIDEDFISINPEADTAVPNFPQPAQGGGKEKNYDDEPSNIATGPASEAPDFGDEESLNAFPTATVMTPADGVDGENSPGVLVQPFAGLPALPDDLAEAVELLKLAVVRHKATGWQSVEVDTVRSYLSAFLVLIDARSK